MIVQRLSSLLGVNHTESELFELVAIIYLGKKIRIHRKEGLLKVQPLGSGDDAKIAIGIIGKCL